MNSGKLPVEEFIGKLAGGEPTPGGGSASALAGALAAALCAMVARLTVGKEKYKAVRQEMKNLRDSADALSVRLLQLVDQDSEAYNQVLSAFRLPREEKEAREEAIELATQQASLVPMETLRTAAQVLDLVEKAIDMGNPNCLTDAGVGALLLRAAARGSAYNVRINLTGIKDQDFNDKLAGESSELLARIEKAVREIEDKIETRIG